MEILIHNLKDLNFWLGIFFGFWIGAFVIDRMYKKSNKQLKERIIKDYQRELANKYIENKLKEEDI